VSKGHVALQRFESILDALNRRAQEELVSDLRLTRNALVRFRSPPDELVWGHKPLAHCDPVTHETVAVRDANKTVTAVLVKHPWITTAKVPVGQQEEDGKEKPTTGPKAAPADLSDRD
jgi:hypothetical protein